MKTNKKGKKQRQLKTKHIPHSFAALIGLSRMEKDSLQRQKKENIGDKNWNPEVFHERVIWNKFCLMHMRRLDGIALLNVDLSITSQFKFNFKVLVNAILYGQIASTSEFWWSKSTPNIFLAKKETLI